MKNFSISTISFGIVIGIVTLILGLSAFLTITYISDRQAANSTAFSSSSATTTHYDIGELLLNTSSATAAVPFNKDNVTKLVNMIYNGAGDAVTQVNSLKTQLTDATGAIEPNAITASDLRSNQYIKSSGQSIVVRLGGLDWIVTFVSKDINGNVVATLWLSSNYQSAWSGKNQNLGDHYGFAGGGLFSDFSDDVISFSRNTSNADNMYGVSYIRCETLNNPENRLYYKTGTAMTATAQKTTIATHPFALFTAEILGLTNYITTPSQMKWMYNVQDPALRNEPTYWLNNESLTANNVYNYQASSGWAYWQADFDEPKVYYDYTAATKYADWGEDYLWLPSMAEVGYGTDSNSVERNGLWELNNAERSNADGSTEYVTTTYIGSTQSNETGKAYNSAWVRSACSGQCHVGYSIAPSGSSIVNSYLYASRAVRPALLLNLTEVVAHIDPTLNVITFNPNGGVLTGNSTLTVAQGDKVTLPNVEKVGYTATWSDALTVNAISSINDFISIQSSGYYVLTGDLNLGTINDWTPLSIFAGVLDGNNWTIKGNLTMSPQNGYAGIFAQLSGATIKNLNFEISITVNNISSGNISAGIIAGRTSNGTTMQNVYIENSALSVPSATQYAGLFAGTAVSTSFKSVCSAENCALTTPSGSSVQTGYVAGKGVNSNSTDFFATNISGATQEFGNGTSSGNTVLSNDLSGEDAGNANNAVLFGNGYGFNGDASSGEMIVAQNPAILSSSDTDVDLSGNIGQEFTFSGYHNHVVTATYTANTYTIKYNASTATSGAMSNSSILFGSGNRITANAYNRTGYTFAGWSMSSTATEATYQNNCIIDTMAVGANNNNATINLYAVWTQKTFTITLISSVATSAGTSSISGQYGQTLPTIIVPQKNNYSFKGYFTQQNGGGTKVYNADGTPVSSTATFASDTTYYAYFVSSFSITASGSTSSFTYSTKVDDDGFDGMLKIVPATGHIVSKFSFDNSTFYPVTCINQNLASTSVALGVEYFANENSNQLLIEFKGILSSNSMPVYIVMEQRAYSGLKTAGSSVSGVVVTATLGGTAYIVGDDFENLEDSDAITVSTILCQPGYAFVGWYLDDDRTTAISTATSYRITKEEAFGHTLVAVYQPNSNNSVNLETDNTE